MELNAENLRQIDELLRRAYGEREDPPHGDLVGELVNTVLSKATNDHNRDRAYASLRRSFPEWAQVAEAPAAAVAAAIRMGGLGDQKAPRIKELLRRLGYGMAAADEAGGRTGEGAGEGTDEGSQNLVKRAATLPVEEAVPALCALPGVGPKTAACALLFALGRPAFPVDTHIHRIALRLGLIPPKSSAVKAQRLIQAAIPPELALQLHLNLIAHGRGVCRPARPRCTSCVLAPHCQQRRNPSDAE